MPLENAPGLPRLPTHSMSPSGRAGIAVQEHALQGGVFAAIVAVLHQQRGDAVAGMRPGRAAVGEVAEHAEVQVGGEGRGVDAEALADPGKLGRAIRIQPVQRLRLPGEEVGARRRERAARRPRRSAAARRRARASPSTPGAAAWARPRA